MPQIDGIELLRRLRQRSNVSQTSQLVCLIKAAG